MAFVITGAFAQTAVPGTSTTDYDAAGTVTVMEGTTVPLYALPDGNYHPSYDADAGTGLTAGFTWYWTEAQGDISFSNNNTDATTYDNFDNYTTMSGFTVANSPYTVNVKEIAPEAWGACTDAGENLTVNVVAQPTATLASTTAIDVCEGNGPTDVVVTTADGWQNYRLVWTLEIATLDAVGGSKDEYFDDEDGNGAAAGQKYVPESASESAPLAIGGAAGGTADIMTVADFLVINSKPTVYTYTLVSINDQASRFGDFITVDGDDTVPEDFTYYAIAGQELVITVNPAPNTGPIYHIINTWAQ